MGQETRIKAISDLKSLRPVPPKGGKPNQDPLKKSKTFTVHMANASNGYNTSESLLATEGGWDTIGQGLWWVINRVRSKLTGWGLENLETAKIVEYHPTN